MDTDNRLLKERFLKKYGTPEGKDEEIALLIRSYGELVGPHSDDTRDGIAEYYHVLIDRKLPAFDWLFESFAEVSRKHRDKKNFGYIVGIMRSWMKNGYKYQPNQEEDEIFDYFEEQTGVELTLETKQTLRYLIGTYGPIRVVRMIGGIEREKDISLLLARQLQDKMTEVYTE